MLKIVTNKTAKFKRGEHCRAAADLITAGLTIPKGTECVINDRHFLSDFYDISVFDVGNEWMLFVDGSELEKIG